MHQTLYCIKLLFSITEILTCIPHSFVHPCHTSHLHFQVLEQHISTYLEMLWYTDHNYNKIVYQHNTFEFFSKLLSKHQFFQIFCPLLTACPCYFFRYSVSSSPLDTKVSLIEHWFSGKASYFCVSRSDQTKNVVTI